jgi:hypothetical protein
LFNECDQTFGIQELRIVVQHYAPTARIEPNLLDPRLVSKKGLEGGRKACEEFRTFYTHAHAARDGMDETAPH